ncbi:AraC-like DNA-binding protein [Chitinophaga skermanii]|uniref:AraC-like DNA-binding protein n=1 Tax=Chitinophaga skermanii TaxID=331697 RepID=A0A327Q5J7_9BACT|nr:helix-turn-helix domain-containing protein [Chitinophaga skermanii]RAI99709.1 AraC-like DNA-binding protein [Chitinophaga skermanii]
MNELLVFKPARDANTLRQPLVPVFDIQPLAGWDEVPGGSLSTLQKTDAYEFIWIQQGTGSLMVDMQNIPLKPYQVYSLSAGQLRKASFSNDVSGFYISLSPELFYLLANETNSAFLSAQCIGIQQVTSVQLDEETIDETGEVLRKIEREYVNNGTHRLEIIKGLFRIFLLYVAGKYVQPEQQELQNKDAQLVKEFMMLLRKQFKQKRLVLDYAKELCVTPNYLNRVVKKVSGFTASHHIQQYIILEAKRRASHSQSSMKEIAYTLGFNDNAHFSKFFKNNTGMNFTSYKRKVSA